MTAKELKWYFGALALVVAVGLFFAYRPAVVLGVDERDLADSVGGALDDPFSALVRCEPAGTDLWECRRGSYVDTSGRPFQVRVGWDGCWTRVDDQRTSGCITWLRLPGF